MAKLELCIHMTDKIDIIKISYGDDVFKINKTRKPTKDNLGNWHIQAECADLGILFELAFDPKTLQFELLDIKQL